MAVERNMDSQISTTCGADCDGAVHSKDLLGRVLVACEYSGAVRDAFAKRGWDAWSADLLPTEAPGNHIVGDVREILNDGWDAMIAHPPCTHLACSGAAWFEKKRADGRQQQGIELFMAFATAPIKRICIENPVGIMSRVWREPDQIIQPYYFGDEYQKTTCLWLKNLPPLQHAAEDDWFATKTHVGKGEMVRYESGKVMPKWYAEARGDGHKRSKTFPGIAEAMANQWTLAMRPNDRIRDPATR
jgi:hypothetical protein